MHVVTTSLDVSERPCVRSVSEFTLLGGRIWARMDRETSLVYLWASPKKWCRMLESMSKVQNPQIKIRNFGKFLKIFRKKSIFFQLLKIIFNTFLSIFGKTFFFGFSWCVFGVLCIVDTTKYTVGATENQAWRPVVDSFYCKLPNRFLSMPSAGPAPRAHSSIWIILY